MPTFTMNEKERAFNLFYKELMSRPSLQRFMRRYGIAVGDRTIKDDCIYNNLIYISDNEITAKYDLVKFMTKSDYQTINSIRFWVYSNDDYTFLIEGGINMTFEMTLLPELRLSDDIKYEYPKEELTAYQRHHRFFDWHQDMTAIVSSLDDGILLLVDTIEKLCEQASYLKEI